MAKLTPEELKARKSKIQDEALAAVAARGQFNFRLDGDDIKRLYAIAGQHKQPVSTMVREWVLQRLGEEEANVPQPAPDWAQRLEDRLLETEACVLTMALSAQQNIAYQEIIQILKERLRAQPKADWSTILSPVQLTKVSVKEPEVELEQTR